MVDADASKGGQEVNANCQWVTAQIHPVVEMENASVASAYVRLGSPEQTAWKANIF